MDRGHGVYHMANIGVRVHKDKEWDSEVGGIPSKFDEFPGRLSNTVFGSIIFHSTIKVTVL